MNKVILCGRLTRDTELRYSNNGGTAIARYTLAVDRRFKQDGGQDADFLPCVAFGKTAEFAGKYFFKWTKILVSGRLETGSYTNKDGAKVYTTTVIVEEQEFAESKSSGNPGGNVSSGGNNDSGDDFVEMMEISDEELPFA